MVVMKQYKYPLLLNGYSPASLEMKGNSTCTDMLMVWSSSVGEGAVFQLGAKRLASARRWNGMSNPQPMDDSPASESLLV